MSALFRVTCSAALLMSACFVMPSQGQEVNRLTRGTSADQAKIQTNKARAASVPEYHSNTVNKDCALNIGATDDPNSKKDDNTRRMKTARGDTIIVTGDVTNLCSGKGR